MKLSSRTTNAAFIVLPHSGCTGCLIWNHVRGPCQSYTPQTHPHAGDHLRVLCQRDLPFPTAIPMTLHLYGALRMGAR